MKIDQERKDRLKKMLNKMKEQILKEAREEMKKNFKLEKNARLLRQ